MYLPMTIFQSTLPVGGATFLLPNGETFSLISIHAPRGGSDNAHAILLSTAYDFNPRSPWGERPGSRGFYCFGCNISIHAPRGGSDPKKR